MLSSRSRRCAVALMAISGLCIPALAGPTIPVGRTIDQVIRTRAGISAYTLQHFDAPASPEEGFETTFTLKGIPHTINFVPTEINAQDCVMSLDVGAAELIDLPAPPSHLYEGTLVGAAGTAIAQLIGGKINILIQLPQETWLVQPLVELIPAAEPSVHLVVATADMIGDNRFCGIDDGVVNNLNGAASRMGASGGFADGNPLLCEVACESDYQFSEMHALNASTTAQDIARVIAWTGKYFTEGANVKFRVTRYVIRLNPVTNPYSSSEPGTLLGQFANHWNLKFTQTQRDIAHLFTGRELDGSVIGIARISALCNIPDAYGLSQSLYNPLLGKRAALTAHEMGHNFSAQHCDAAGSLCQPCRIMLAGAGVGIQNLSFGCSGPFIGFFAENSPCLEPTEGSGGTGGPCRPDVNFDGQLTLADFGAFQSAFIHGLTPIADFNHDGRLTTADFGAFQTAFATGCQ